jgi:hypothetical protein
VSLNLYTLVMLFIMNLSLDDSYKAVSFKATSHKTMPTGKEHTISGRSDKHIINKAKD